MDLKTRIEYWFTNESLKFAFDLDDITYSEFLEILDCIIQEKKEIISQAKVKK